jgi:Protein of unknown function (DUF3108)
MRYRRWMAAQWARNALVGAVPLLATAPLLVQPALAEAATLPETVTAVYRVSFGLLGEIGSFRFTSTVNGEAYALAAEAKIDTAVFDYSGAMTSMGSVLAAVTKPGSYQFRYKQKAVLGKKKKRALEMAFDGTGVKDITFVPPDPPSKAAIPVTKEQLQHVLDPLSGVMALSLGNMAKPCEQTLPIFDGKQRFDVVFSSAGGAKRAGADHLCHVRLVAISGHKPGEGSASVITGDIEVVLRAVPKANILVPYRVTVPTIIGAAVLASEKVEITMPDQKRIAFKR